MPTSNLLQTTIVTFLLWRLNGNELVLKVNQFQENMLLIYPLNSFKKQVYCKIYLK